VHNYLLALGITHLESIQTSSSSCFPSLSPCFVRLIQTTTQRNPREVRRNGRQLLSAICLVIAIFSPPTRNHCIWSGLPVFVGSVSAFKQSGVEAVYSYLKLPYSCRDGVMVR